MNNPNLTLEPASEAAVSPAGTQLRILVVENHPDTLKYLCMYLELMGHTVQAAHDKAESLALLSNGRYDAMISDIGLPDGSGWDLLKEAPEPKPGYAIAMSGFGMNADRSRSLAAGFRHHLLKPFPPEDLDDLLSDAAKEMNA